MDRQLLRPFLLLLHPFLGVRRVLLMFGSLVVGLSLCTLVGCGEYLPMSSGALTGKVTPLPKSWSDVAAAEIIQLETNPADPYSVNLWVIGDGELLYVFAGDNHTQWVQHIEVDPRVRLQIGEAVYQLEASRVTDAAEFERFAQAWDAKYGHRPRNESVTETWLIRLSQRQT